MEVLDDPLKYPFVVLAFDWDFKANTGHTLEAFFDDSSNVSISADCCEGVHHFFTDESWHLAPFLFYRKSMELGGLARPSRQLEARAVRTSGAIKGNRRFNFFHGRGERIAVRRSADETATRDFELIPTGWRAARAREALPEVGKGDLIQIASSDYTVETHSIAYFACDLQHALLNSRYHHRNLGVFDWRWRKIGRHQ